jgi:hypothetical protein
LDSSIIQGPFSVAPCQTLISRFATFSSPYDDGWPSSRRLRRRRASWAGELRRPTGSRRWPSRPTGSLPHSLSATAEDALGDAEPGSCTESFAESSQRGAEPGSFTESFTESSQRGAVSGSGGTERDATCAAPPASHSHGSGFENGPSKLGTAGVLTRPARGRQVCWNISTSNRDPPYWTPTAPHRL